MERLRHHLRPLVVAVATLALSAGVVLAGGGGLTMPEAAADGLAKASAAADKPVPVVARPQAPEVEEQPAAPAEPADEQAAEEETAAEPCPMLAPDEYETHGAKVCAAAHADVPDNYANRGAYVREVARDNHGAEVKAEKAARRPGRREGGEAEGQGEGPGRRRPGGRGPPGRQGRPSLSGRSSPASHESSRRREAPALRFPVPSPCRAVTPQRTTTAWSGPPAPTRSRPA